MTKIDIYAMIPGAGEQTWTIWTSNVSKECAKIQACLKEHKLYQTDNVIMSVDPSFNNCSTLLEVALKMMGIRRLISTVLCPIGEKKALLKRFANVMVARCMVRMKNCRHHTIAN